MDALSLCAAERPASCLAARRGMLHVRGREREALLRTGGARYHHEHAFALGGTTTLENLRLCAGLTTRCLRSGISGGRTSSARSAHDGTRRRTRLSRDSKIVTWPHATFRECSSAALRSWPCSLQARSS